jgi:hypothetical protein
MAAGTDGAISRVPNVKIIENLRSQTFMGSEAGAVSEEGGWLTVLQSGSRNVSLDSSTVP